MSKLKLFKEALEGLYAPEINRHMGKPTLLDDGTVVPYKPDFEAVGLSEEIINDVVNSHAELDDKIASLESLLSIIQQVIPANSNLIDRYAAQALESFQPNFFHRNYPVNSFTMKPSNTNRAIAMEAIDKKVVGIIAAVIAAIIALVAKFSGWGSSKVKDIEINLEKAAEGATKEEIDNISKGTEEAVAEAKKEDPSLSGADVDINKIHAALVDALWSDVSVKTNGLNMGLLMEVIRTRGTNGPYMKFYQAINNSIYIWKMAADGIFQNNSSAKSGMLASFLTNLKQISPGDQAVDATIESAVKSLRASCYGTLQTCVESISTALRSSGVDYDFQKMPVISAWNEDDPEQMVGGVRKAMVEFLTWMRTNQEDIIKQENGKVSAKDFPKDLCTNIKTYDEYVVSAATSRPFDISQWAKLVDDRYMKRLEKDIEAQQKLITAAADRMLIKKDDGSYYFPSVTKVAPAVNEVVNAYSAMIQVISYYVSTVKYGSNVFVLWREHFVPRLNKLAKEQAAEIKKKAKKS